MQRNSRSLAAEAAFRARLSELGAELLEPEWLGAQAKHHIRCAAGHDAHTRPASIQQGNGICRTCAGQDPSLSEAAFRRHIEELGGAVLYDKWQGVSKPHHVRCREGHDCNPRPSCVRRGQGICKTCAGRDTRVTEAAFRAAIEQAGGTPLYEQWHGIKAKHHVRCPAGHDCYPRPNDTQQGIGICKTCAGQDPVAAEAAFRAQLAALGATPLFDRWIGRKARYRIRCAAGHIRNPWADTVLNGRGACMICAGLDPAMAEAAFREELAKAGATPAYEKWQGVDRPLHVRCAEGHDCYPRPGNIQRGGRICVTCADRSFTVFYVLEHQSEPLVKFGISSREGRRRLADHRGDGFTIVHMLATGLAGRAAEEAEKAVLSALALANARPHRGREYFPAAHLALILDVAAGWLRTTGTPVTEAGAETVPGWVQDMLSAA